MYFKKMYLATNCHVQHQDRAKYFQLSCINEIFTLHAYVPGKSGQVRGGTTPECVIFFLKFLPPFPSILNFFKFL